MANGFVTSRPGARAGSTEAGWPFGDSGAVVAQKFVAPGSGTLNISEIGAWFNNSGSGAAARLAIFTHDSSNDCPEAMVLGSESTTLTESGSVVAIHYATLSSCSITGGDTYWLVGFNGGSTGWDLTSGGGTYKGVRGQTPYTWPTGATWHAPDDTGSDTFGFYAVYSAGVSASIDQEGFRFRNDDGSETTATWKASQDTNSSIAKDTNIRIRLIENYTGDISSVTSLLKYSVNGGAKRTVH